MATILVMSTWGSDDPTRATLPFLTALGAVEVGQQAEIYLLGEAVFLMKDYIVDQIDGVGWPPLKELMPKVIDAGIPIQV